MRRGGFHGVILKTKKVNAYTLEKCQFCSYQYPLLCQCCNAGMLLLLLLQLPLLLSQLLSLPLLVNPTASPIATFTGADAGHNSNRWLLSLLLPHIIV